MTPETKIALLNLAYIYENSTGVTLDLFQDELTYDGDTVDPETLLDAETDAVNAYNAQVTAVQAQAADYTAMATALLADREILS